MINFVSNTSVSLLILTRKALIINEKLSQELLEDTYKEIREKRVNEYEVLKKTLKDDGAFLSIYLYFAE